MTGSEQRQLDLYSLSNHPFFKPLKLGATEDDDTARGEGLRLRFGTCAMDGGGAGREDGLRLRLVPDLTGLFVGGGGDVRVIEWRDRACRNNISCLVLTESTILRTFSLSSFNSLSNLIVFTSPFLRILIAADWALLSFWSLRLSGKNLSIRRDFLRAAVRRGMVGRGMNGGAFGFSCRERKRGTSGKLTELELAPVLIDMIHEIRGVDDG